MNITKWTSKPSPYGGQQNLVFRMHLERIWFAAPFLFVLLTIVSSLRSGKFLNARGANPMIVNRADNLGAYKVQIVLRVLFLAVLGWMAVEVIFIAP